MKIVPLKTGATCITLADKQVIFVDPDLTPDEVFNAVQQALPKAHPDAIHHWVEAAMPSTTPLSSHTPTRTVPTVKARREGLHRAAKTAGVASKRIASLTTAAAAGAAAIIFAQGNPVAPVAAAEAWENPVFTRLGTDSNWDCAGTDSADLIATCTTPDGIQMHAEAWVGPNSLSFTFAYQTTAPTGELQPQRNTMIVFSSPGAKQAWLNQTPDRKAFPHLIIGERWIMYGTDPKRLKSWAGRLGENVVLPADVAMAAFQMGLLPSPKQDAGNKREMAHLDEVVRRQATRIILGDASLPVRMAPPPPGVGPTPPAGRVDFPFPGRSAGSPVPLPGPVVSPPPPPPSSTPTPDPTSPPPVPDPTTPPPVPTPTTEPTPDQTSPPPEPTPTTDPTAPADETPAPEQSMPGVPADGTPEVPEDSTPGVPADRTPEVPAESPPGVPADGTPELPEESQPHGPEEGSVQPPTEQPNDTTQPDQPVEGDDAAPGQGPAQHDDKPTGVADELTKPIHVPADVPTPVFDEVRNTPPIFAALQAEFHRGPGHAMARRAA